MNKIPFNYFIQDTNNFKIDADIPTDWSVSALDILTKIQDSANTNRERGENKSSKGSGASSQMDKPPSSSYVSTISLSPVSKGKGKISPSVLGSKSEGPPPVQYPFVPSAPCLMNRIQSGPYSSTRTKENLMNALRVSDKSNRKKNKPLKLTKSAPVLVVDLANAESDEYLEASSSISPQCSPVEEEHTDNADLLPDDAFSDFLFLGTVSPRCEDDPSVDIDVEPPLIEKENDSCAFQIADPSAIQSVVESSNMNEHDYVLIIDALDVTDSQAKGNFESRGSDDVQSQEQDATGALCDLSWAKSSESSHNNNKTNILILPSAHQTNKEVNDQVKEVDLDTLDQNRPTTTLSLTSDFNSQAVPLQSETILPVKNICSDVPKIEESGTLPGLPNIGMIDKNSEHPAAIKYVDEETSKDRENATSCCIIQ